MHKRIVWGMVIAGPANWVLAREGHKTLIGQGHKVSPM
jgi:hypothetical protein